MMFADGFDPRSVPIHDAATVMLVRDAAGGLEVFMLRRTMAAVFAGGLYVFPGGRVDAADAGPEYQAICAGLDDVTASARLELTSGGLAFYVGAIRECFEEAGVLLAVDPAGEVVRFETAETIARFETARHAIHDGTRSLADLCAEEGLRLMAGAIGFAAHWLTPIGERRRFDTRFFLARAPEAQTPLHDDRETVESLWIRPADALDRNVRGELAMLPPTIANVRFLAGFDSAATALAAVEARGRPSRIDPKARLDIHGRFVALLVPGDPEYDDAPEFEIV